MSKPIVEIFEGAQITEEILLSAAKLFSENYGVWGPKMGGKNGTRVKMTARILKTKCMASTGNCVYARATLDGSLIGNVLTVCYKDKDSHPICWITQLCVFTAKLCGSLFGLAKEKSNPKWDQIPPPVAVVETS